MSQREAHPWRDQPESAFASILEALVASVPGARGAALVDLLGETVDYAGRGAPFDLRVAAAHWRIVLEETRSQTSFSGLKWLAVRAARGTYVVHALPDGYALVLVLVRAAGLFGWDRAVGTCARALGEEAGRHWGSLSGPSWFSVEVVSDARLRPRAIRLANELRPLEILGTLVRPAGPAAGGALPLDLAHRERGWRVRLETGVEATLVREPGGVWYADEALDRAHGVHIVLGSRKTV
jgi:hypothetical protein